MQSGEVVSFDVPMRLFGLQLQIDGMGEMLVERVVGGRSLLVSYIGSSSVLKRHVGSKFSECAPRRSNFNENPSPGLATVCLCSEDPREKI